MLREAVLPGDPIGLQAGRVDHVARPPRTANRVDLIASPPTKPVGQREGDALPLGILPHRVEHRAGVGRRCPGRPDRPLAGFHPWLDPPRLRLRDALQLDAVGGSTPHEFVHLWVIGHGAGHHQLPAAVERQPATLAVGREGPIAIAGEPGLEGIGRVIKAGVEHPTVAAAGMAAAAGLLLQHGDCKIGMPAAEFAGDRNPDDATTDDEKICGGHGGTDRLRRSQEAGAESVASVSVIVLATTCPRSPARYTRNSLSGRRVASG